MGRITHEPAAVETELTRGIDVAAVPARADGMPAHSPNPTRHATADNVRRRGRGLHPPGVRDLTN
jgi:hypothetical protein